MEPFNLLMRTIYILSIITMILLASSPSIAEDDYVIIAKSLLAKDYDETLLSIPVEKWLISVLPQGIDAKWNPNITDCGEQTGDPTIDKDRDVPICAEIELNDNGRSVGYLSLVIGSTKNGISKTRAKLYYGYIKRYEKRVNIRKLSDLSKLK